MKLRNRRLISVLLAASMVFSLNTVTFAGEIQTVSEENADSAENTADFILDVDEDMEAAGAEAVIDSPDSAAEEDSDTDAAVDEENNEKKDEKSNVLTGNLTLFPGGPTVRAKGDFTVSVDDIKSAIVDNLEIRSGNTDYYVSDHRLIRKNDNVVISNNFIDDSVSIDLIGIRRAGAAVKDAKDINYTDNSKITIKDVRGNQLVNYTATINKGVFPGTESNKINGDVLIKISLPSVSSQRILFGGGKYAIRIDYDSAVEYRGNKITVTCHQMAGGIKPPNGDVDGALGVAVRLEKVSGNVFVPIDDKIYPNVISENNNRTDNDYWLNSEYENYFWKDSNGITLKRPKVYNAKNIGAYYEDNAPYFIIPMTYSKKTIVGDTLTTADKQDLKSKLASTKIYFTIQPRRLSNDTITYNKYEPEKFYVKKLVLKSSSGRLTGTVQFRDYKTQKTSLNVRKLKNVGKKLRFTTRSAYETNGSLKSDAYYEYDSDRNGMLLTGINGYYGSAFITKNFNVK